MGKLKILLVAAMAAFSLTATAIDHSSAAGKPQQASIVPHRSKHGKATPPLDLAFLANQHKQQEIARAKWFAAVAANDRDRWLRAVAANEYWHRVAIWSAGVQRAQAQARWKAQQQTRHVQQQSQVHTYVSSGGGIPSSLSGVVQCIKNHESGNYSESSHPSSGSGAYQFIPSTWRTWSAAAGYPGYAYAYEAPPSVQDAVLAYTLTHGGSHNWDPAFGNDPCTVGMP